MLYNNYIKHFVDPNDEAKGVKIGSCACTNEVLKTTTRINWIENNAMPPDSIMMIMIDQKLSPASHDGAQSVLVQVRSGGSVLLPRNTLKILNTINHITRACIHGHRHGETDDRQCVAQAGNYESSLYNEFWDGTHSSYPGS